MMFLSKAKLSLAMVLAVVILVSVTGTVLHYRVRAAEPTTMVAATNPTATKPANWTELEVTAVVEEHSDKLLGEVLAGIEENRKKLKTLMVQGQTTWEEWKPDKQAWEVSMSISGTAWIETAEPRRTRVEVGLQHTAWANGAAPYIDSSFTEAWDGSRTQRYEMGGRHSPERAGIYPVRELWGLGVAGVGFSPVFMGGMFLADGRLVDQYDLDPKGLKTQELGARRVVLNGKQKAVELTAEQTFGLKTGPIRVTRRYWFDADRGYGLLGKRHTNDHSDSGDEAVIDTLVEAAPDVFYPGRGHYRDWFKGGLRERHEFVAQQVVANQPIAEEKFSVTFPENAEVTGYKRSANGTWDAVRAGASEPASQP